MPQADQEAGSEEEGRVQGGRFGHQLGYGENLQTLWAVSTDHPGLVILKQNACISCHSSDGSKIIGPSFKGLWNKTELVETNGETREITVDRDYVRKSLNEPNADITQGFNKGLMISYKETISDEQMDQIIDYLKTIK